jgi:RNA polymerase sigma factor for flagellar operon FliA
MSENAHGEEHLQLNERLPDPHAAKPDAAMLSAENRRSMVKCLAALPKTQGTVIVLHYLHNVPLREVAAILSVTPSRVSQLHHQALERLKQSWRRNQTLA